MEIANAFSELNDPDVQRERFEAQRRLDAAGDDGDAALRRGVRARRSSRACRRPAASALGIDRLVMLLTGRDSIREVVLFPAMRELIGPVSASARARAGTAGAVRAELGAHRACR